MNRRVAIAVSALGALCLLPAAASAYNTKKSASSGKTLRWATMPMKYDIHGGTAAPGVSAAATQSAVRSAYAAWNNVSCSYFKGADQGLVNRPSGNGSDGTNTNVWLRAWPAGYSGSALGVTRIMYNPANGRISDADTVYNSNYQWSTTGARGKTDIMSVAAHEIGHQLGLDHSGHGTATMYYATRSGDTHQRSLHSDDMAGVCALYNGGSPAPPECVKDADCTSATQVCKAKKCVARPKGGYGTVCGHGGDCSSTLCIKATTGKSMCSQRCDSTTCPAGDRCVGLVGGGKACLPASAPPAAPKLNLGAVCSSNTQCKTTTCAGLPDGSRRCTQSCTTGSNNCPSGFHCSNNTSAGGLCVLGNQPNPTKPPAPSKMPLGFNCATSSDCASGICGQLGKSKVCTKICDVKNATSCPSDFRCAAASGGRGACIKKATATTPGGAPKKAWLGAVCRTGADCSSGLCASGPSGQRFCTQLCFAAGAGNGCPSNFGCVTAGGNQFVCTPSSWTASSAGCSVTAASGDESGLLGFALIGGLMLLVVVRRQR